MKFRIEGEILRDYPGLVVGMIVARGVVNSGDSQEIASLLRLVQADVRSKFSDIDLSQHPHITPWREAYAKFGAKPKDYRCSSEALLRMVLSGRDLRHINTLVDLYNYISLRYILTLGGEDLDTMKGDLVLAYAEGNESFIPLGSNVNDPPTLGEVVYKDDEGIICRRWNWREGDRTKLTELTKNVVLVAEGLPPIERSVVENATKELAELVKKYCGEETRVEFLGKGNPEVKLL